MNPESFQNQLEQLASCLQLKNQNSGLSGLPDCNCRRLFTNFAQGLKETPEKFQKNKAGVPVSSLLVDSSVVIRGPCAPRCRMQLSKTPIVVPISALLFTGLLFVFVATGVQATWSNWSIAIAIAAAISALLAAMSRLQFLNQRSVAKRRQRVKKLDEVRAQQAAKKQEEVRSQQAAAQQAADAARLRGKVI